MKGNSNGMQGAPPCRALWKAQADTGRADYFRWTFKTGTGAEIVLSVGKRYRDGLGHAASADTCEVLLWWRGMGAQCYLAPEDISCLLEPWSRFFTGDKSETIALHMPDSILDSFLYALKYHFELVKHTTSILKGSYYEAT